MTTIDKRPFICDVDGQTVEGSVSRLSEPGPTIQVFLVETEVKGRKCKFDIVGSGTYWEVRVLSFFNESEIAALHTFSHYASTAALVFEKALIDLYRTDPDSGILASDEEEGA